jgi:hypothetical protein
VFRCPEKRKGWGVRCIDDLQAGTFVIDYVGEVWDTKFYYYISLLLLLYT